jgi:signal peptidase I
MEKSLFTINGQSLYPVFKAGDSVELKKIKTVKRFDYVVFDFLERLICKRVVGMPGDRFEIIGDNLVINNSEEYPMYGRKTLQHFSESFQKILIDDEYIVLGNNNSLDSANFGPVNRRLIVGKLNAKS